MRKRSLFSLLAALTLGAAVLAVPAQAAGETVNIWLTTTNDSGGRNVTRGLQQQAPITFAAGTGSGGLTINVNENTRFQQFGGGGATFTDTAACMVNASGSLIKIPHNEHLHK